MVTQQQAVTAIISLMLWMVNQDGEKQRLSPETRQGRVGTTRCKPGCLHPRPHVASQ